MRPVIKASEALISLEYRLYNTRWLARAKHVSGKGFSVDVWRDGIRYASCDGQWPKHGEGNRDVALVAHVLDCAIKAIAP